MKSGDYVPFFSSANTMRYLEYLTRRSKF